MSHLVRASHAGDLDSLYRIAKRTGGGFTNLPPDRDFLKEKLERVDASFAIDSEPAAEDQFLFVLEDVPSGAVVGTCQIFAQIGYTSPFYSYRVGRQSHFSRALKRTFHIDTLTLCTDLNGAGEVGGLYLHPEARATGLGKLLARSRYLFVKAHISRFPERIIAELRGVYDELGNSPFWDGLAGRFFNMSFREADDFNAVHGSGFIEDVMPADPIFPVLLNDAARAVIGLPHHSGRAAMRMLEEENFVFANYIDVFDGGPTLIAPTAEIRTIAEAQQSPIVAIHDLEGDVQLLAFGRGADFRACYGVVSAAETGVVLATEAARLLGATCGNILLHAPR